MAEQLDQCEIRMAAEALGVHRGDNGIIQTNPSAVLGTNEIAPLTMATSFAAIANSGVVCEPIVVDRFVTATGTEIPGQEPQCRQGITADVAAAAASPMRSVITGGTGTRSNPGGTVPVIGKTGTTDSQVQTWMVGSSTEVATAVWVGNVIGDYRLSRYRNGTVLRHDIFRIIMQAANEQYGGEAFPAAPERLVRGSGISLPDITGLGVAEATILLESLGLKLEVVAGAEGGRVGSFEPAAGTFLARGMTVRVVSGGGGDAPRIDVMMPNLVGLSVAAAYQQLDSIGQSGWREATCDAGSPGSDPNNGTVTSQNIAAGDMLPTFKGVALGVACGVVATPPDELFLD
jgi:membrane peptidoglycan carboxypeptidase